MALFDVRNYGATGTDSTNDTAAIQKALDAAHAAGGGQVYIPKGTYILTGTGDASDGALRVYSNTELFGDGMGQTVLKVADGYAQKITGMIRTPVNEVTTDVVIRDLTLDGNRANASAEVDGLMTGVLPGSPLQDARILVERVEIHDVSRIAFNPHEQTTDLVIRGCVAHHNSWDGFIGDFVSNAVYENNVAYANDRHGFNIVTHSHDTIVRGNVSYDNGESGIVVQRGGGSKSVEGWETLLNRDVLVENNLVYGNGSFGILLKQTELCQIVNNIVHHNGMSGVRIEGAHDNLVAGNTITDEAQGIEVTRYPGSLPGPDESYGNILLGNLLDRMAEAIQESGSTTTGNLYTDNVVLAGTIQINPGSLIDDNAIIPVFDKIEVALNFPTIDGKTYGGVTLYGTEGNDLLVGNNGDDTMYGQDGNDTLVGNAGNDVLKGRDENDMLQGGNGSDELYGGQNDDRLEGGNGNDFLYGDDLVTPGGNDVMSGGAGNDLMKGRFGEDTMYGDDGDDKMWGGEGTDLLYGGAGVDALYGGEGNDILSGGEGADKLSGEEGNDILAGGFSVDSLYGGLGADRFMFSLLEVASGMDNVKDFSMTQGDVVLLTDLLDGMGGRSVYDVVGMIQTDTRTILTVDLDGASGPGDAQSVVSLSGLTGVDLKTLMDTGHLLVT